MEAICSYLECQTLSEAQAIIYAAILGLCGAVLAILGAVVVGWRQAEILRRQTEIQDAALELERIKLRSELYDRRIAIYDAANKYLSTFLSRVKGFPFAEGDNVSEEAGSMFEFNQAMTASVT